MTIKRIRKGSGLSVRTEVKITDPTLDEMRELFGDRSQFGPTSWFEKVRENCRAVLEAHGLPSVVAAYYSIDGGPWRAGEEAAREARAVGDLIVEGRGVGRRYQATWSLLQIVEGAGHAYDSPPGFAARLLDFLGDAEVARKQGHFDAHAFAMAKFGHTLAAAQFAAVFQANAERGSKSMAGSKLGGQMSRAGRRICSQKEDRAIREAFDAIRAARPKLQLKVIYADLAGRFKFVAKTIKRSLDRTAMASGDQIDHLKKPHQKSTD
jgi:hypothetical protein